MRSFQLFLYFLFLVFSLFGPTTSRSQKNEELVLHKIDDQNGLSDNNVQCIYKDKNNFVWIGTASGLDLMDGSDITVFKNEVGNPNSISNNNITAITADNKGVLWIGTTGGVNSFNFKTRKFAWFPLNENASIKNQPVSSLLTDSANNLYIATLEGLFFLDHKAGKLKMLKIPGDQRTFAADNGITHLLKDQSGRIWITTYHGLWSYDQDKNLFMNEVNEKNDPLFTGLFTSSTIDHEGKIWLGTWDRGLKKYDPVTKTITTFPEINNGQIVSLAEIKQPNGSYLIWINGNFQAFDPATNKVIQLPIAPGYSKSILINDLYASTDNWLWIGTHQGLYFYNPAKSLFTQHRFPAPITSQIVAMLQWKDKILVSGTGSYFLRAYDSNFNETDNYSTDIQKKDLSCLCLRFSGSNTLKAGTSSGIADINLNTHKITVQKLAFLRKNFMSGNFITSLLKDKMGKWWVFPWRYGIWQSDSSYKNFHQVFNNFIMMNERPKALVIADAVEDRNGNLWFADLDEGIIFYNRQKNIFSKPFIRVVGDRRVMTQILYYHNYCYSFSGTEIYKWHPNNLRIETIELPSQNDKAISSIAIDSIGNLWMATQQGLIVYNLKNRVFDRFTTADGIISNEIDATMMCTSNGTILIGSPDYLSSFVPARLLSSIDHAPHIRMTEMIANGQPLTIDSSREMIFGHTINNFIFKWTVTDYNNPVNNHFYYLLKGIDKTWRSAGNHGQVEFANLSPGQYTLLLKGENSNGVNADTILSMHFTILAPFWRTWWFLALIFFSIAVFFYSLYRYRLNQGLKIEKLRNKISLDLHDDIGSTLSSISILSEIAMHENKMQQAEAMLHEIKENSLSLMERMDDIVWSINPNNDSLESLFLRIQAFASRMFEAKEINYSIKIDEQIKHEQLQMEYRQHIYLILKEAINNLVKYSECTQVEIAVNHVGSHLLIVIKDNGNGFEIDKTRHGNGLNSMKQRARYMNADLKIISAVNEGTGISLTVKIK